MKPSIVRRCRVCLCTDMDCSGCIQRTGKPCHWVSEDLCSACADGYNTLIRVQRGNNNVATVKVGGRTHRASCTSAEVTACQRAAQKAAAAVKATAWRVEQYRTLSIDAGRAALFLEFGVCKCTTYEIDAGHNGHCPLSAGVGGSKLPENPAERERKTDARTETD